MENEMIEKHQEMVSRLKKPGELIKETMTARDCDFVHMGGCLMGEAGEIYAAVSEGCSSGELLEELGDMAFYLVAVGSILELPQWTGSEGGAKKGASCYEASVRMMHLGADMWDVIKRVAIYRKPLDAPDSKFNNATLRNVARVYLDQMENQLRAIMASHSYSLAEVLEANWTKLADADKGRYASGAYSDEQAQARRDKSDRQ